MEVTLGWGVQRELGVCSSQVLSSNPHEPPLCPRPSPKPWEPQFQSVRLDKALPRHLALIFQPRFEGSTRPYLGKFGEVLTLDKVKTEHVPSAGGQIHITMGLSPAPRRYETSEPVCRGDGFPSSLPSVCLRQDSEQKGKGFP